MGAPAEEAYKDNGPVQLHHIIPLDFSSIQTLPDSHVWPHDAAGDESPLIQFPTDQVSIPVIDLADPDAPRLIREACETWGIFQLLGHGIPTRLMQDVGVEAENLFGLPVDQKLKALRSPGEATGYGLPRISSFFDKHMWHEGFTIMGSPVYHAALLWPHSYQPFCNTMDEFKNEMKGLTERLIRVIFELLNTTSEGVTKGSMMTSLQLNSYPACPDPTRAMGLAPHTDTSILTLLKQYKTSGLQVFKDGVGWVPVQPVAGAITVNLGDFLHIISNGQFTSVRHRVVANHIQRFSVAYFYAPPSDFIVSPVQGQGPKYRSVTVKEYVDIKSKHLEKALSLIRN